HVDQMLQLRSPIREVLDLIQEDVGLFAVPGRLIQRLTQDRVRVPLREVENRFGQSSQLGKFVKLNSEDPLRGQALVQQCGNGLVQQRGLANLARTAQHHGGSQARPKAVEDRLECPSAQVR